MFQATQKVKKIKEATLISVYFNVSFNLEVVLTEVSASVWLSKHRSFTPGIGLETNIVNVYFSQKEGTNWYRTLNQGTTENQNLELTEYKTCV